MRAMDLPPSLTETMAAFRDRGVVAQYREGMFLPASWLAVYYGQRIMPDRVNPLVAALPVGQACARVAAVAEACRRTAEAMPTHADYLARIGAAA